MYFEQSDLFRGMSRDFLKEFMEIAVKESHKKGDFLFRKGDKANYFFILLKGSVKIRLGETGDMVSTVDRAGEAFGWSSLVGRPFYSASAECRESTKLIKVEADTLLKILQREPANGLIFFRHLASTLGNRLLQTYTILSDGSQPEIHTSFGTGQVQESAATTA
jgi:CRP-like cAMP-binding protein